MAAHIKRKLDLIAKHINELNATLKKEYGSEAFIFFEAEGAAHAMSGDDESSSSDAGTRQAYVIASSARCNFDCGAW